MIRSKCPKCLQPFGVSEASAGAVVACPHCGQKLRMPPAQPAAPPPPPVQIAVAPPPAPPPVVSPVVARPPAPPVIPPTPQAPPEEELVEIIAAGPPPAVVPPPLPPREEADLPQFETEPYQPDGNCSFGGAALLIGLSLPAGVFLGFLASFIGQWMYLIFIFPFLIGLALGGAGYIGIRVGKVRSPFLAGLAGFIGGCVAMLSVQFFDYLRNAAGFTTFFGYIDLAARSGVTIGRAASSTTDKGMNLGHVGTYIYWFLELLVVGGVAFFIMRNMASEPFCPECETWKQRKKVATFRSPLGHVVNAVQEGDLVRLLAQEEWSPKGGDGVLTASVCPNCKSRSTIDVKLEQVIKTAKNQETKKELAHVTYPGKAWRAVQDLIRRDDEA
jgi:hypothetical protein